MENSAQRLLVAPRFGQHPGKIAQFCTPSWHLTRSGEALRHQRRSAATSLPLRFSIWQHRRRNLTAARGMGAQQLRAK
jgi:uncharacterized protein (DUF302 family)